MTTSSSSAPAHLVGTVHECGKTQLLPAWVRLTDEQGGIVQDAGVHDSLRGFPCDGTFDVALPPGRYEIAVHRLISHEWFVSSLLVKAGEQITLNCELKPWLDPAARGFFCGESHDHLNHPQDPKVVVKYCEALGISYLDVCQGWMSQREKDRVVSGDEMARMLESYSTETFHMYFGGERPKKRFGHTWWNNLPPFKDPYGEYMGWHDPDYVAFASKHTGDADVEIQPNCPFTGELPFSVWRRLRAQGAVGVAAHPTSWWLERADQKLVITNIAADLIYGLLSGCTPDAIVAMGYDPDQIFYQNVWFHLLNEGYHLPAVAETDGDMRGSHHIGQILGYTQTPDRTYTRAGIAEALRTGRTMMTSGPFVIFTADDGQHRMGDSIQLDHPGHQLEVEAWSDPDPAEFLSGIIVYRNGERILTEDLREQKTRHHRLILPVKEHGERAWYVVKVYGSTYPTEDRFLDVFSYATLCEEEPHTEYQAIKQVALTNPIYFVPKGWTPTGPVQCHLHLETIPGAHIVIEELGVMQAEITADSHGRAETTVSPLADLTITAAGIAPMKRSIFLDYAPVRQHVEYCYSGQWRGQTRSGMLPGQVPWSGFAWAALRESLQEIHWCILPETSN